MEKIIVSENKYKDYLKGKRVILVGPAPSTEGTKQKEFIESFDIVVRMNVALPVPLDRIEDIGERCDILYNNMNQEPVNGGRLDPNYLNETVKFLASSFPIIDPFKKDIIKFNNENKGYVPFHIFDNDLYNQLTKDIQCRPNIGISAIVDLLSYEISELYITGITFFQGGYDKSYRNLTESQIVTYMDRYGIHKQEPQKKFFKELYEKEDRIKVDKTLEKIIKTI